ncbi:hypothetical protein GQ457_02G042440 [Hibiscus cannabinus]
MSFRVFRTNYAYLFDQELARILEESKEEQAQRRSKGIGIKDQDFELDIRSSVSFRLKSQVLTMLVLTLSFACMLVA